MLSIQKVSLKNATCYLALAQEDYYLNGGEPPSQWHGQGARALGLAGVVKPEQFHDLFRGFSPVNQEPLVQNAGQSSGYLRTVRPGDRATEFKQRCRGLGIEGVTLHSYRYAWAERAKTAGYPERFAQEALGHNRKAVHRAYAKRALVKVPSLDDWEQQWQEAPQQITQPEVLLADFQAAPVATRDGGADSATATFSR